MIQLGKAGIVPGKVSLMQSPVPKLSRGENVIYSGPIRKALEFTQCGKGSLFCSIRTVYLPAHLDGMAHLFGGKLLWQHLYLDLHGTRILAKLILWMAEYNP